MAAIEKRQSEQFSQISRQLAVLSQRGSKRPPSPEQLLERERRREHERRMKQDPAYVRKVQEQRLAGLQQQFSSEPVDHRWSTETRSFASETLLAAASRAGAKLKRTELDCRSSTCRITLDVPAEYVYEDVITYLMTDLAEVLPNAQLVVMPLDKGVRTVNIFARKPITGARPPEG